MSRKRDGTLREVITGNIREVIIGTIRVLMEGTLLKVIILAV